MAVRIQIVVLASILLQAVHSGAEIMGVSKPILSSSAMQLWPFFLGMSVIVLGPLFWRPAPLAALPVRVANRNRQHRRSAV